MTNTVIRAELHHYIDTTDDAKIEALYTLLRDDIEQKHTYTDNELGVLHERAEKYLRGESKTYTAEESHNKIKEQKKNNEL